MKRFLALAVAAVMLGAVVSLTSAAVCTQEGASFCDFGDGCYEMSSEYSGGLKADGSKCTAGNCTCAEVVANCVAYGALYSGVDKTKPGMGEPGYGAGVKCADAGGTVVGKPLLDLGCCKWSTEGTKCYPVTKEEDEGYCQSGANVYWKEQCGAKNEDDSRVCPTATPTYDGSSKTPEDWVTCTGDNSGFCKWATGCSKISTCTGGDPGSDCANAEATCGEAFENCLSNSPTQTVYEDAACSTPKKSGGVDVGGAGHCKIDGLLAFCGYEPYGDGAGGCYKVQNQYAPNIGKTCDELISACKNDYGKLYTGSTSPSVLDSEPYGDGESCSALGLTPVSGDAVRHLGSKAAAPNLKVAYSKGRVSVNWNPGVKVSSGTVQLLNVKGVAMSTAFIKANSGKVSVKLGTVGVPAGMYFVKIDAVGQNGKKLVSHSAISIVK
jgi:hypothetical protein